MSRQQSLQRLALGSQRPQGHPDPDDLAAQLPLERRTYLTAVEAVTYLGLPSRKALYGFLDRHPGLHRFYMGRSLRFLRRDLDDFVQGRHVKSLRRAG